MYRQVESTLPQSIPQGLICPECGSQTVVRDKERGEVYCVGCGLVIKENLVDLSPEWRAFSLKEKQELRRTGPPTLYISYDKRLSTTFKPYKDASGKSLPLRTRRQMFRLRRLNLRVRMRDSSLRNLIKATSEIMRISEKLNLSHSLREVAANIYRKALTKNLIRGRSIDTIAAASIYAACRITKTPRNLRDILKVINRDRKEITRCYRLIVSNLGLMMPIDDPMKFVPKIRSKIGVSLTVENRAVEIIREAKQTGILLGKDPVGVAAATLYIAGRLCGEKVSQKKIAEVSEVTEVTIRNRYKDLMKALNLRFDEKRKTKK